MQKVIALFLCCTVSTLPLFAANEQPVKIINTTSNSLEKQNTQGVDGKFARDLFTGAAGYTYSFQFPKGTRGIGPDLSLRYSSNNRDSASVVGYGWDTNLSRIYRNSRVGTDALYTTNSFVVDGEELVEVDSTNHVYRSKNANNLSRYIFSSGSWSVEDTQGNIFVYGQDTDARVADPENPNKVFAWMLESITDPFGNTVHYGYSQDASGNAKISSIKYAFDTQGVPLYEIQFHYLPKTRSTISHRTQWELKSNQLISEVVLLANSQEVKKYILSYDDLDAPFSHLTGIQSSSHGEMLPKVQFTYGTGKDLHLLTHIDNGYGYAVQLSYTPSTAYKKGSDLANAKLPLLLMTLSQIDYTDDVTHQSFSEKIEYEGGHYYYDSTDIFGREYAGFYKVTVVDNVGKKEINYFHQSQTSEDGASLGEAPDHISKKGHVFRQEIWDTDKKVLTKVTHWTHTSQGNDRYLVVPSWNTVIYFSESGHQDIGESYEYDAYGQQTKKIMYGHVNADISTGAFNDEGTDRRDIITTYAINSEKNLFGYEHTSTLIDNFGATVQKMEKLYDEQAPGEVSKGQITREKFWTSSQDFITKNYSYDTRGLLASIQDPNNHTHTMNYDSYGLFVVSLTNPKGWTETMTPDYAAGKIASHTNANGTKITQTFDYFGRPVDQFVQTQGGNPILVQSQTYDTTTLPFSQKTVQYFGENDSRETTLYFDGLGKPLQSREQGMGNGEYYVSKVRYDAYGNASFLSYPRAENGLAYTGIQTEEAGTTNTYDVLGRIVTRSDASGQVRYTYDGLQTTVTNQKQKQTSFTYNPWGNLELVIESNNNVTSLTRYDYNAQNKLTRITDAYNNTRAFEYDWLGRVTTLEDLHTPGVTPPAIHLAYDGNSNILSRTVQSGEEITWTYDSLNRVTSESYPTAQGVSLTEFKYDIGNNARGLMTSMKKDDYEQEYQYNGFGQKIGETVHYGLDNYAFSYQYNLANMITQVVFPDESVQTNTYEHGFPTSVSYDGQPIITSITYNAANKPVQTQYANGIVTHMLYDYTHGYRLSGKQSVSGNTNYQVLSYTFDAVGNITETRESGLPELRKTITYNYDDINRLTKARYVMGGDTTNVVEERYTYDAIGNMLTGPAYTSATFGGSTGANPHAITQADSTLFAYDIRGNLHQKTTTAGTSQYDFNLKNQMVAYTDAFGTTNYDYDATGRRILKVTGDTVTQYVNRYLEVEKPRTETTENVAVPEEILPEESAPPTEENTTPPPEENASIEQTTPPPEVPPENAETPPTNSSEPPPEAPSTETPTTPPEDPQTPPENPETPPESPAPETPSNNN